MEPRAACGMSVDCELMLVVCIMSAGVCVVRVGNRLDAEDQLRWLAVQT